MFKSKKTSLKGFTMIETAIVILVGGIIMAAGASALKQYLTQAQIKATRTRLAEIDDAMLQYLKVNNKLPCVASLTAVQETPEFGVEVNNGNCSGAAPAAPGVVQTTVAGTGGREILVGAVPVRSLNLSDQHMTDAWGNRFTYAVTEVLATPGAFDETLGAISVLDANGNPAALPAGQIYYVVVSHGPNNVGAFSTDGRLITACPAAGTTLETLNCGRTNQFRHTTRNSTVAGANLFDDYITYKNINSIGSTGPDIQTRTSPIPVAGDFWVDCPQGYRAIACSNANVNGTDICRLTEPNMFDNPAAVPLGLISSCKFSNCPAGTYRGTSTCLRF